MNRVSPDVSASVALMPLVLEAYDLGSKESAAATARLAELDALALTFIGQSLSVRCLTGTRDKSYVSGPITAGYFGHQDTEAWVDDVRSPIKRPGSMCLVPHPLHASGQIERVKLGQSEIRLKPRIFSPYRRHNGFFIVRLLNERGEPFVEIKQ